MIVSRVSLRHAILSLVAQRSTRPLGAFSAPRPASTASDLPAHPAAAYPTLLRPPLHQQRRSRSKSSARPSSADRNTFPPSSAHPSSPSSSKPPFRRRTRRDDRSNASPRRPPASARGRQPRRPSFSAPARPTVATAVRKLRDAVVRLAADGGANDGHADGEHAATEEGGHHDAAQRILTYGVRGRALAQLTGLEAEYGGVVDEGSAAAKAAWQRRAAEELLASWAQVAVPEMARVAKEAKRSADTGKSDDERGKRKDKSTCASAASLPAVDVAEVATAYAVEGEEALKRLAMANFLDWVEARLQDLVAERQGRRRDSLDSHTADEAGRQTLVAPTTTTTARAPAVDQDAVSALVQIRAVRRAVDLSRPALQYPVARSLRRHIHLHVGPTNSGKTHGALLALCKARTGVYAGPLRLLAHEVWERINRGSVSPGVPPRACNLLTGEEQRTVDPLAGLVACTVEMASVETPWEVAVVDEIQMIGDAQRGSAWTAAVLGLAAKQLHLCGEASAIPLVRRIAESCGDEVTVHEYERLTPLEVESTSLEGDLSRVRRGDCLVTFSRNGIFHLKRSVEARTGLRCAVAYGGLPPETRSEQARLFNDPESELDVMVASDAIGMGLNLKIKRVIFETLSKWNGTEQVVLSASQIKQIAGRAGRYGTGSESGGAVTTLREDDLPILGDALAAPLLPIEHAAIQPASEAISELNDLLSGAPPEHHERPGGGGGGGGGAVAVRSLSQLYEDVACLAKVDSTSYYLSQFDQQHALSPVVEAACSPMPEPTAMDDQPDRTTTKTGRGGARRDAAPSASSSSSAKAWRLAYSLSVEERERFSNAPANTRDERVVRLLESLVRGFAQGRLVRFDEAARGLEMLESLEDVESLMRLARRRMARSLGLRGGRGAVAAGSGEGDEGAGARSERGEVVSSSSSSSAPASPSTTSEARVDRAATTATGSTSTEGASMDVLSSAPALARFLSEDSARWDDEVEDGEGEAGERDTGEATSTAGDAGDGGTNDDAEEATRASASKRVADATSRLNVNVLMVLESLHRCLTLYLWLSMRFPLHFCHRDQVASFKARCESAIVFCLEAIRFGRQQRLSQRERRRLLEEQQQQRA